MIIQKKIIKYNIYCILYFLITISIVQASTIHFKLEGINDILQKNVKAHLSKVNIDNFYNKLHFKKNIIKSIKDGLRPFGYYEPSIQLLKSNKYSLLQNNNIIIVVKIKLGPSINIKNSNIVIYGTAKNDVDFQKIIKENKPKIGSRLNHNNYEIFKKKIFNLSQKKGYFDAFFKKKELNVSIEKHESFWNIHYYSGIRYSFGDTNFYGSKIKNIYLNNIKSFKKGDKYQSYSILELNRKLSLTGWFNTILVTPDINYKKKIVPINVLLSPNNKNVIEIGIGYSNDVLLRMKSIWKKPWINCFGHSLISSFYISKLEKKINFSYKIPILKNPIDHYFLLKGEWKSNNYYKKSNNTTFIISRYWDSEISWQKSINLHWSFDHFIKRNKINNTMLIYPGINIHRIMKYGNLIPYKGISQNYSIDISSMFFLSNVNFIIFKAQNTWINSIYNKKHRIILRSNIGWILTHNLKKIPINLRFFAGGDHSIRGYKYNEIFPRKNFENVIGALKLITGSIEYQYNFSNKLWNVIFIDTGDALNNIKKFKFKTGIGLGIRWRLPIGPVKFDISFPINHSIGDRFQFYIGLGPEL